MPPVPERFTLHENALATAMVQKVGDVATRNVQDGSLVVHHASPLNHDQRGELAREYAQDPKESLAWARESLIAVAADRRFSPSARSERMDRYLSGYTDLIIKLDRAAFPNTKPGKVNFGVPNYVPQRFNDMGRESSLNPDHRSREIIHVDKRAIFKKYRPVLRELFMGDYSGMSSTDKKLAMAGLLAEKVYFGFPYDHGNKDLGPGKKDLARMDEGVCRHQALVFQTLAQAAGLKTGLLKAELGYDGAMLGYHAANTLRVNGRWYILDVTNPDIYVQGGKNYWRPGIIPIPSSPEGSTGAVYTGVLKHSKQTVKYAAHNRMYWTIG